jgi:hypothetical protein
MCYIYGKRFVGRITPLILELRNELYKTPYSEVDWDSARNLCAKVCLPSAFLINAGVCETIYQQYNTISYEAMMSQN